MCEVCIIPNSTLQLEGDVFYTLRVCVCLEGRVHGSK